MTSIRGSVLIGAALLLLSVVSAQAGGMWNRGGMKDGYHPAIMTNPTWYLRLDGAYAAHDTPIVVEEGRFDLIQREYDSTWSFGGGLGRYFTQSVRADLTYDYRFSSDISGRGGATTVFGLRQFGLESQVFLANIYYDFNRGGRINPYIGVGLGTVYHQTETGIAQGCGCTGTIASGDNWHVAGAFMAGASLKLRQKWHLDVGYRFLYLGEVDTGSVTMPTVPGTVANNISAEDLHAHEFRFGVRYDIR